MKATTFASAAASGYSEAASGYSAAAFGYIGAAALGLAVACAAQTPIQANPLPAAKADPAIAAAIAKISAANVQSDIARLVAFGTRSTLSSIDTDQPAGHGINAAADWIESEFQAIASQCGGCLEVKRGTFEEPASTARGSRILKPTRLTNVYAILHGTEKSAPWVLVTGHYDSRATDVMDSHVTAPGANDDASGTAVSIESARALTAAWNNGLKLPGTIVFVAAAGEEQGLNGSRHLAHVAKEQGWPLEAVLNNDIVGGDTTPGETMQDKSAVRVFSESIPGNATPELQRQYLSLGAENDSPSRQLARTIAELAPAYFAPSLLKAPPAAPGHARSHLVREVPAFHPVLILRRDRYLRAGDHTSFNGEGFAAVRFTEWRENYDHQHQTVRTENGVEYGDLLKFVDFDYVMNVAKMDSAMLASLAAAPGEPQNVKVLTRSLDNNTELAWDAPAYAPAGTTYQIVWREPTEMMWTHAQSAGAALQIKLNVSKDNVLFGVRSVDSAGHVSPAVAPMPAGRPPSALPGTAGQ